ncbi:hypothetical protein V6N13_116272 [Hibiscus sabdariffa]
MRRLQQRSNYTCDYFVKSQAENQELKDVVSELEESLQNEYQSESKKLKITKGDVKKRQGLMTNVRSQVREVAEKIDGLTGEAEILNLKVGSKSHCGKELTHFLDEIEKLGVRVGLYFNSFALI